MSKRCLRVNNQLDGQRAIDGADTMDASQPQGSRPVGEYGQPPDGLAGCGEPVQDLGVMVWDG